MARSIAKDHDEKRAALLKTAAGFFARHGYDRASMSELAKACGVSKALIYHYYDSKDAILFDILHGHLSDLVNAVASIPETGNAETRLRALTGTILDAYRDADAEHKVQLDALSALPAASQIELKQMQRRLVDIMADAIGATKPALFARRPELLKPATMSAFGMLNWAYIWRREGTGMSREDYAAMVADFVLGGLQRIARGDMPEAVPEIRQAVS